MKILILIVLVYSIVNADFVRDTNNQIIIDTKTNLIWQDNANVIEDYKTKSVNGKYNWEATFEFCNNLSIGSFINWRVPNINELKTLINYNVNRPSIYSDFVYQGAVINGSEMYYISSTSLLSDSLKAWRINFYTGFTSTEAKDNSTGTPSIYLRCVTNR